MTVDLRPVPRRLAVVLMASIAVLVLLHLVTVYLQEYTDVGSIQGAGTFVQLFTMNDELAVPAWFASLLIFLAGAAVACLGGLQADRRLRRGWLLLAAVFVFLSADEMASIHEGLSTPLQRAFDLPGVLYYAWVLPYGVGALAVALVSLRVLRSLPAPVLRRMVLAGALFVGGAVGMELLGGWLVSAGSGETIGYRLAHTVEEVGELAGMALFLHTVVAHLVSRVPTMRLGVAASEAEVTAGAR